MAIDGRGRAAKIEIDGVSAKLNGSGCGFGEYLGVASKKLNMNGNARGSSTTVRKLWNMPVKNMGRGREFVHPEKLRHTIGKTTTLGHERAHRRICHTFHRCERQRWASFA